MSRTDVEVERESVASADTRAANEYVIMVGETPSSSAPTLTLSKALERLGVAVRFAEPAKLRRIEWVRLLRSATLILLVSYEGIDPYLLSQLATAVAMDVPIVRWWVGTDVLNALARDDAQSAAKRLNTIVSTNIAVAPHLVEELASVGILAHYVPSVLDPGLISSQVIAWSDAPKPVLVYMPGWRKDFYGLSVIEPAIVANPHITFIVVADDTHRLACHPNVESLGWVADMSSIYERAGCVLRVTSHDGLPRMLIEALLRGLYGMYSWRLDGCWEVRTTDDILDALRRYEAAQTPNEAGRAAMLQLLSARPDQKMSGIIADASVAPWRRVHALTMAVRTKMFPSQFR